MSGAIPVPPDVGSFAIELPSWVGDAVMATPVLRAARDSRPQARIVGIMRPGLDAILSGSPFFDEMITIEPPGFFGTARAMRRATADAVLLLPNSFRSALAARVSGAPIRIGYARDGRGLLLTHRLRFDRRERPIAAIEYYARLARFAFGLETIDLTTRLFVTEEERSSAGRLLGADVDAPLAVLNPGANRADKRWPPERFAAVGDHLAGTRGMRIAINGSPSEATVVREVASKCSRCKPINLAERGVTLASLKGVIAQASLVITNDTGPRHIACALGVPTVALFGPTDHRWTTLNVPHERVIVANPFLPENLVADDHPQECPIERIAAADVIAAAESLLKDSRAA